jgi:fermentation-respiration switch protein FrsA (DUF1100 family)
VGAVSKYLFIFFLTLRVVLADGAGMVSVRFDPTNPQIGPFPTDSLTVPDSTQITGKRMNLPLPDCTALPALCNQLALIDQLDGFNVQPRITVAFSGPVATSTLRAGIFLVALDNLTSDEIGLQKTGDTVAINQVVYDPATNTAYAKPDAALDQHRRYVLLVTDAIQDTSGNPITPDPAFTSCANASTPGSYCADLANVLAVAQATSNHIVAASIFTTQSATAWLESARRGLQCMPVVVHHPDGQYVFNFANIASLGVNFDTGSGNFDGFSLPVAQYSFLFSGLGRVAFLSYLSPLLLNAQQTINGTPTGVDVTVPTPANEIAFHVYLPNTPEPPNGYPVVIFGHGFGDSSIGAPTVVSPALAQAGFATIAVNAVGHGFGPKSNVVLTDNSGNSTTVLLGGRGLDLNGDGTIDSTEGCEILTPLPIGLRDCIRQTVVDLTQLVRVIQAGLDVDGDGAPDLDPGHIYYAGQSFGSIYGTVFNAVEPAVRAAALNVGGGSIVDIVRWSPGFSGTAATILTSQNPPLLPPGTPFSDNFPFRDQPVSINGPGNSDTQYYLELIEWLDNSGDPIPFAPHLARSTLPGVPAKSILFQIARGDMTVPNPASSDLILAAGMASSTWMYRFDLAKMAFPGQLASDPHTFLTPFSEAGNGTVTAPTVPALLIGLAAQGQMSGFLASDGASIPDLTQTLVGSYFEIPKPLPEDLGFTQ